jgi:hypothetical protein
MRYALGGPRPALELVRLGARTGTAMRALAAVLRRLAPVVGNVASEAST